MIAVIFEVVPAPGRMHLYLDTARDLRPLLENIDGFISIERFRSLTDQTRLLSLSFWRDEAAVKAAAHSRQRSSMEEHSTAIDRWLPAPTTTAPLHASRTAGTTKATVAATIRRRWRLLGRPPGVVTAGRRRRATA